MRALVAGEALIDLIGLDSLVPHVGGAPLNAACALSHFMDVTFASAISTDRFGELIYKKLKAHNVVSSVTSNKPTPLALVSLDVNGDASYSFYLKDTTLFEEPQALDSKKDARFDVAITGALALATKELRECTVNFLSQYGAPLMIDVNVRKSALLSLEVDFKDYSNAILNLAKEIFILKVSNEDLDFLLEQAGINLCVMDNLDANLHPTDKLLSTLKSLGSKIILLSLGERGALLYSDGKFYAHKAKKIAVVDTVGAGDCLGAVFLSSFLESRDLERSLIYSVDAATLSCATAGANIPKLPEF